VNVTADTGNSTNRGYEPTIQSGGFSVDGPDEGLNRRIRQRIQLDFPISADPFGDLAQSLGCTRDEVYDRVAAWRRAGVIRRLGPIYDSAALGRTATLCAGRCPPSALDRVAGVLGRLDEVTHAYLREGEGTDLNLWFTLSAPSSGALLERLSAVERDMGVGPIISLPTRRLFKVRAVFDVPAGIAEPAGGCATTTGVPRPVLPGRGSVHARPGKTGRGTRREGHCRARRVIAATQRGLPDGLDPYGHVAADLGLDRQAVLDVLIRFRRTGVIRRVGAILDQRRLGLAGNCLVAWRVPADRVEAVGPALAAEPAVSHCCERDSAPEWPYNMYAMVHAADDAACRHLVEDLARQTAGGAARAGDVPRVLLFTRRELKKTPPRYA